MTKHEEFCLMADVARALRCKPYQIAYLLSSGQVPEPALRLGNRRMFTRADIDRIAAKLVALPPGRDDA